MKELKLLVIKGFILSTVFLKEMAYHMKEFMERWGWNSNDRHL